MLGLMSVSEKKSGKKRAMQGFKQTSALLQSHIRKLGESRGFAQPRVLTHWREIVGEDLADVTYPTEVSYAKQGFGGTLTILTMGAHAPMIEMQKESLRRRVNAIYGYNAIRRIRITQTSAHGFAEAQAVFAPQSKPRQSVRTKPQRHRRKPLQSRCVMQSCVALLNSWGRMF